MNNKQSGFNWKSENDGWLVPYNELCDSFALAMKEAGVASLIVAEVLAIVEDFAVNQLGDD